MGVSVLGVTKRFDKAAAIEGISFEVPDGKLLSVLGPSGSGKTTLLRCIAGIETPDSGVVKIGSRIVFDASNGTDVPPEDRGIGMVFQSNALWPHMTVRKNIAYPLEIRGVKEADARISEVLDLLKMTKLADRFPSEISGGEQQRVAIARAIVYRPSLVLLDEPFSNLDALLRESLRDELRQLQIRLGMTMVYVTHDRVDAMSIGDLMAIISEGRVMAFGSPGSLLRSPPNSYTARFLGGMLAVEGVASPRGEGLVEVNTKFGTLNVLGRHPGGRVWLCVPPSACMLVRDQRPVSIPGTLAGVVMQPSGFYGMRVATDYGTVEVPSTDSEETEKPGARVYVAFDADKCLLLNE
jgi:iron(III) transport system ATP-binding protein